MKEFKGTKGEWQVVQGNGSQMSVFADKRAICFVPMFHETAEHDLKLIAAAPDLLRAIRELDKHLDKAAEILDIYASQKGAHSALSPKLRMYAKRIKEAQSKALD